MFKEMSLRKHRNIMGQVRVYLPGLIVMGLFSSLIIACGDTTPASNPAAVTANSNSLTTAVAISPAPNSLTTSPATVVEITTTSPTLSDTAEPAATTKSPEPTANLRTLEINTPIPTTASAPIPPPVATRVPTPSVAPRTSPAITMEAAITAGKAKVSSTLRADQQRWLEALPTTPGSKLYTYPTCGNIPTLPDNTKTDVASVCQSNMLGTTQAVNNNGNWEITFMLVWPGKLPPGMARPQSGHTWQLVVTPTGQVRVTTDSGAPLPAYRELL